ncbi:MAG: HD domain-containing protein [Defluviitaleaceae bacterium]|nr:HD domain-containing protein [Defluviitaleaceae bacterium]
MWDNLSNESILSMLEKSYFLSEKRILHSVRVMETALKIGMSFTTDQEILEKIRIAALLHDCGKELAKKMNLSETEHGYIGAILVEDDLDIEDLDILRAISNHTTGDVFMGFIEKVIFLADMTEPMRMEYFADKIEAINKFLFEFKKIDIAVHLGLVFKIAETERKMKCVSPKSKLAEDYYLGKLPCP